MKSPTTPNREALAMLADLIARRVVAELGLVPPGNRPKKSETPEFPEEIEQTNGARARAGPRR